MTDKLIRAEALQRYNGIEADAEGVYVMLDDVRALLAGAQPEEPGLRVAFKKWLQENVGSGEDGNEAYDGEVNALCAIALVARPAVSNTAQQPPIDFATRTGGTDAARPAVSNTAQQPPIDFATRTGGTDAARPVEGEKK